MISIGFDDRGKIGLQYVLESLHACSPFGIERVQKLRFYSPAERAALETELGNVERAKNAAGACAAQYEAIMAALCQLKDVRGSLKRLSAEETLDHVELFEIKGFLLRIADLIPLFAEMNETVRAEGIAFHDPEPALDVLDPERTRSRGFYIPDGATEALKRIRAEKKRLEQRLYEAETEPEKNEIRLLRTRVCADEEAEERTVRKAMCEKLRPFVSAMLSDADAAGRLDFLIQKALFAVRYGAVRPGITETALELIDMTNPELVDLLKEKGRAFVPVSIAADRGATVITGANMGGKSVAMKTVALNVLLMHAGFLVCAKQARIPMFSCVKMLFDDAQSMQSGLSGFGSEIVRFNEALEEAEKGYSLFLLDEFAPGRGRSHRAGGHAVPERRQRDLDPRDALRRRRGIRENALSDRRPPRRRSGIDPRRAGVRNGGRSCGHRAAHGLRSLPRRRKGGLPEGRAAYLPHAVDETGDPGAHRNGVLSRFFLDNGPENRV